MDRAGWSGTRLAREVGTSQPWVSMVLSGTRDPGLRRSAELLAKAGWELQLVPVKEDPVKRQEFLLGAASLFFLPSPAASPYTSVDYVNKLAGRLAHNEAQLGGAPLAREAIRHVNRLGPVVASKAPALHAAASRLCRQAALVLHDVRDLNRAETVATTAHTFARKAADPVTQVEALDTLSLISAHLPDGRGAEYARRGLAVRGADNATRAGLSARLGRSQALAPGCERDARTSLETALEQAAECGELSAEVVGNTGIGFSDLGMPARAEQHLADAVALTASSPFLQSLYVARQAKTAIRARNPEVAAHRMGALTSIAPLVDSPRLRIHERHIYDGTRRWDGIADIRDAREALREERHDGRPATNV